MRTSAFGVSASLLFCIGCGDGGSTGANVGTEVRDSAGIRIVDNIVSGELAPIALDEIRRIGAVDGDEHYLLSQVYALDVSPDNRVFVGNNQTATVRVFDADGVFVTEFGGRGEGPGEIGSMVNEVWLAGDTVVVTDWQRYGETHLFTTAGEHLATWTMMRQDRSSINVGARGDSGWIANYSPPSVRPEGSPGDSVSAGNRFHVYNPDTDSIGEALPLPTVYRPLYVTRAGSRDWPLFRSAGFGFDARGRFYHHQGQGYSIRVYDSDGTLSRIIRRSFEPVPITDADIEQYMQITLATFDTMQQVHDREGQRKRIEERMAEQATFPLPPHAPVVRDLLVSDDGALWVENLEGMAPAVIEASHMFGGFEQMREEGSTWDLFDPEGRFVGQVRLPPRFDPQAVRGAEVTGVMRDELDVEYVVTLAARTGG